MPPPDQVAANEIWLARYSDAFGFFQADSLTYAQLAQFIRKMTIGDATKDSDDYISSWVMGNWAGGGQVEEINEGAETDRFWTAFAETSSPNRNALPLLVTAVRPNANCTDCYPLDVGNDDVMYVAFLESGTWKVWGFNETTRAFDFNGGAGVSMGTTAPAGKAVRFDGVIYVPLGSAGYRRITGSSGVPTVSAAIGAADPTTPDPTSAPRPVAFTIFNQRLYAITAEGGIAYHTIAQKDAGANAWHWPYGTTTTDFPHIESSALPRNMAVFPDKSGVESLYIKTTRGLLIFDDNNPIFLETHVEFPPHPDINQSMCIWPPGGDLHAPVGLNDVKYSTAFVVDPHFGLARDHGLPNELRGSITDIEATVDRLYAAVGGVSEVNLSTYVYSAQVGAPGTGNGQFDNVTGIIVDPSGNVWVTDRSNHRVQKFNSSLVYQSQFGSVGTGNGQFGSAQGPTGIASDASGNLFVADFSNNRVQKFNSAGTYQSQFAAGVAFGPWSIAIKASSGAIYVACISDNVIQRFNSAGVLQSSWGSTGTSDGQFTTPLGIAIDQTTGDVYVADTDNDRIQQFTSTGTFVRKWGSTGSGDGQFQAPVSIAVHPISGNVFVTDTTRDDVQEFTSTGSFVRKFGSSGTGNGQYQGASGLAFNSAATSLFISDDGVERIQKFISETAGALTSYPSLHYWTGVGWHGAWKGASTAAIPRFLKVGSTAAAYRLWMGMSDGYAYFMKLRRTFHNARTGYLAGIDEFAPSGTIETGFFDAAMEGFDKIASHLMFLDPVASSTETITVEFKTDSGGWEPLGTVSASANKTALPFDIVGGFSRGRRFNKMALRFTKARGSDTHLTPLIDAATLHFTKVPQNTTSFNISLPLSPYKDRGAFEQYNDLTNLVTAGEFLPLIHRRDSYDSDGVLIPAQFRVLIASVSGIHDTGGSGTGRADLSLIAVPDGR